MNVLLYYIIIITIQFIIINALGHNSHKANYRDSAQTHNTKYYTSNKQPQTKYIQKT
jgi:hypothetical protein